MQNVFKEISPATSLFRFSLYFLSAVINLAVISVIALPTQATTKQISQRLDPTEDGFLQPLPDPAETQLPEDEPILPPQESTEPEIEIPEGSIVRLFVNQLEVVGSTVLTPEQIAAVTEPLENREVTLAELIQAADAIAQLYWAAGYVNSTAIVGEQAVEDGIVQISVTEGRLQEIQIEGLQRLNPGYVRSRLQQANTVPLNANQIEEQLRLLRADPNLDTIRGQLNPGERPGESVLVVQATESKPWSAGIGVDNYSPPSVGSERMRASLGYRNLTSLGDNLGVTYYRTTTGGSNILDATYQVPVNAMDGTLSLRAVLNDNRVTQGGIIPFSVNGDSQRYEIGFRQPLVRRLQDEFALSLGFSFRDGTTLLRTTDANSFITSTDRSTSVVKFGQDYTHRDARGTWALRSQLNLGFSSQDITSETSTSDSSTFFSWLGQVQRVQQLGRDHLFIAQADLQLAPDSLPPSEQYVLGGGQSLRGYRQNARIGDNGVRVSIEDRITLSRDEDTTPVWQLAPFLDLGAVWNSKEGLSNDQNFLAGVGIGSLFTTAEGINFRVDYALPLVDIDDRSNNAQDDGFYFTVNYQY